MHNYKQHINAKAVVELYHFVMTLQWKAQCCIDQLRKYVTTRWRKRYSTLKPGKMKYYRNLRKRLWGKDWDWKHPWCDSHYIISTLASHRLLLFLSHNEQNIRNQKEKIAVFFHCRDWWRGGGGGETFALPVTACLASHLSARYLPSCKTLCRW